MSLLAIFQEAQAALSKKRPLKTNALHGYTSFNRRTALSQLLLRGSSDLGRVTATISAAYFGKMDVDRNTARIKRNKNLVEGVTGKADIR